MTLKQKIESKTAVIGVLGLGFIGLSMLEAFAKSGFPLVGYDINKEKVEALKQEKSPSLFLPQPELFSLLRKGHFEPSSSPEILKKADVVIICVPTPLDCHQVPDFSFLRLAFKTVLPLLKKDLLVVIQSTTYPGTTEEEALPLFEKSGLKAGKDFFLSYVPEILDVGNPSYAFTDLPRIISGITPQCAEMAKQLYQNFTAHASVCSSPKIAESAKTLQNAFRLLNIAFINEMKVAFDRMNIDIWEVIQAASTKPFGFMPFYPGPGIGGDCIPITPLFLSWKAKASNGTTSLIDLAAAVNVTTPYYVLDKIIEGLNRSQKSLHNADILLLGIAFRKDIDDIRESPSLKIFTLLKNMKANVDYHDPWVPKIHSLQIETIDLNKKDIAHYDCVVILTDHSSYNWGEIVQKSRLIIDTRNVTRGLKDGKEKVVMA